jgi:hypothetical protein
MNKVSISTVTPVYAGREYLRELIDKIENVKLQWQEDQAPLELTEAIFANQPF